MRTLILVGTLVSAAAWAQATETELFVDRGDTFMRVGTDHGVQVGTLVTVLGDKIANTEERRRVGTGTVMEVWPALARIALDEAAKADKSAKKFVAVKAGRVATSPPPPPPPSADGKRAPVVPPAPAGGGTLRGHATFGGAGPWKLLRLWNDDDFAWTSCTLSLPGNLSYKLGRLKASDVESVALSNFVQQGKEIDVPQTSLTVKCAEGGNRFLFPD